ncbi:MAG: class I SAM-dependent methyltransferase [Ferruginibacter sp.]
MNRIAPDIYSSFTPLKEDVQGWHSNHIIFVKLIEKLRPETIIEVGTWKGASAIQMGKACQRLKLNTKIYCVDTWLGATEFWTDLKDTPERDLMLKNGYPGIYYQFLSNVKHAGLEEMIIPVPNTSFIGSKILAHMNIKAGLIYIDGSHEYEDVYSDLNCYDNLLADKGVMFGDDYGWNGVRRAVDDFVSIKKMSGVNGQGEFKVVDDNFWVYQKH